MRVFKQHTTLGVIAALAMMLSACGATHKSAQDVEGIFQGQAISLERKVFDICSSLTSGNRGPSLDGVTYAQQACQQPGAKAQNLRSLKDFSFSAVETSGQKFSTNNPDPNQKNATNKITFRAELWLNQSLLGLAGKMLQALKNGKLSPATTVNGGAQQQATIDVVEGPIIDKDELRVQALINFESLATQNGAVDIRNQILVDAAKVGNAFVASATFKEELDSKVSFAKNIKALVFIIPHAQDIYIDLMIDAEFHSFGVGSTVEQRVIDAVRNAVEVSLKDLMNF